MSPHPDSLSTAGDPPTTDAGSEITAKHAVWDQLGILGSAICIVHCLATPLVIGYLAGAGLGFVGEEIFHKILAAPLLLIALLAFLPGYQRHHDRRILASGMAGVGLLLLAVFVVEAFVTHEVATALTVVGSILLIGAHGANWRQSRCPSDNCGSACP